MTGSIINLHGDRHRKIQELLPWYATGQLDEAEHAEVEAHLATCAECQAELNFDHRLHLALTDLPADVDQGWAMMRRKLQARTAEAPPAARPAPRRPLMSPRWLGWAIAAQAALLVVGGALLYQLDRSTARYHALSSGSAPAAANLVAIFRPDLTEKGMRELLRANGAVLVGGPTAADAYMLRVAPGVRAGALARLRSNPAVVLAEPVDKP